VVAQVTAAIDATVAAAGLAAPVVTGKSLASLSAPVVADRGLPAIWLTPVLTDEPTVSALRAARGPCLLVGGTSDQLWDGGNEAAQQARRSGTAEMVGNLGYQSGVVTCAGTGVLRSEGDLSVRTCACYVGESARRFCSLLLCTSLMRNEFRHVRSFCIGGPGFFRVGQAVAAARITTALMTVSIRIA
jgi:hypothetical protein